MSVTGLITVPSAVVPLSEGGGGGGFEAPGPQSFDLPPVFSVGGVDVTKPMLLLVVAAVVVFVFFWMAARKRALVPGKLQFAGEEAYSMVRNGMARDIIGSKDFRPFVPYLITVFFFILVCNIFGSVPFLQFPAFGRSGPAYALAGLSWVIYNAIGIKRHGFLGYLKHTCVPAGISGVMLLLLIPLEFMSNILVRPVTLALRLFCNMFAGHILALLFATGGEYLVLHGTSWIHPVAGVAAWILAVAVGFLELLVQFLQAYVFTLLNAMYISGAVADEH